MKLTKIMLACIATFLLTWIFVAFIVYMLSDMTYKQSMTHQAVIFSVFMFLGWVPTVIVGMDLDAKIRD